MNKSLKKWSLRIILTGVVSIISIVGAILNPGILYAKKTTVGPYTIHHTTELDDDFKLRLQAAHELISKSELYDENIELELCLNDGSFYPELMELLRGPAFGWGLHNIAIFKGKANYQTNVIELNGYKWNLEQLFSHELTHCLQSNYLGFFNVKPLVDYPNWKWEGYPEYVSRKEEHQQSLFENIRRLKEAKEQNPDEWGVFFEDGTVAPKSYYEYWLLVTYCLENKGMSYPELLQSDLDKITISKEMENWYQSQ